MVELKAISYEESRLEYFRKQRDSAKRRMNYWCGAKQANRVGWMEASDRASEASAQYNFYKDALEALAAQTKWISVNERLPVAYDDGSVDAVLVTDGSFIHMAYFIGGKWHFCESGEMKEEMFYSVTHWMLLPELPRRTFSRSLAAKHENEPVRKDG